jgi:hypothetical protein
VGVNVTWQAALPVVPVPASAHRPALPKEPVLGADVNDTVPEGVLTPLAAVSRTVVVQVVGLPVTTDAGVQATVAEVR